MQADAGCAGMDNECQKDMIVGLQELPRDDAGWKTYEAEGWSIVAHRHVDAWRGEGIMFRKDQWAVMRRKCHGKGLWVRLKHVHTGLQLWVVDARVHSRAACQRSA